MVSSRSSYSSAREVRVPKNKVHNTLDDLEDTVCEFIRNCDTQILRQICSLGYELS